MDPRGFALEPAAPPDASAERPRQADARPAMRAAPPDPNDDDARADEEADEPGYGHGV